MNQPRFLVLTAAALLLLISACSTPKDLTGPTLAPQFGTRNYDSVEDVAYGKAGYLYAVGVWGNTRDTREGGDEYDDAGGGESDAFLRRYDRSGNLVWENFLDVEPGWEYASAKYRAAAHAVAVDGSGNAFVAWSAEYLAYDSQTGRFYTFDKFDFLSKYSPGGIRLWRVATDSAASDLATDSTGNVYATSRGALTKYTASGSRSWSKVNGVTPTGVAVSSSNHVYIVRGDGYVIKYTSSGTQLFAKTSALDGRNATDYKIAVGVGDELYVTGSYMYDYDTTEDICDSPAATISYYVRLYKIGKDGVRQWFRNTATQRVGEFYSCWDGGHRDGWGSEDGLNVATDSTGNAYVATGANNGDAVVTKHNRSGTLTWSKTFSSGFDLDGATSVATYDGSEVFVGAVTYGSLAHRNLGGSDAVLREMNGSGNRVWTR